MAVFTATLTQMLMIFTFIAIGILLKKKRILPDNANLTMSRLFIYVFNSAMACYTMMQYCTVKSFKENSKLILIGFIMCVASILLSYLLSKWFVKNPERTRELDYTRCVFRYGFAFANYGTLGSFLILGLGDYELLFKYFMFRLTMEILSNSWGLYTLLPKDGSASMSKNIIRGLLTPPNIGLMVGMVLGLLNAYPIIQNYIPFLETVFSNASNCMGPIAMIITGFVVGGYDFKELLSRKKSYAFTAMRLIILPCIALIILKALGASNDLLIFGAVAYGAPAGTNLILFPSAFGGDTHTGASMTMITAILAPLTVPLLFAIFNIALG